MTVNAATRTVTGGPIVGGWIAYACEPAHERFCEYPCIQVLRIPMHSVSVLLCNIFTSYVMDLLLYVTGMPGRRRTERWPDRPSRLPVMAGLDRAIDPRKSVRRDPIVPVEMAGSSPAMTGTQPGPGTHCGDEMRAAMTGMGCMARERTPAASSDACGATRRVIRARWRSLEESYCAGQHQMGRGADNRRCRAIGITNPRPAGQMPQPVRPSSFRR